MHPLHQALVAAAAGTYPPVDGAVDVELPDSGGDHGVFEFTGHAYVLTDRSARDVLRRGADGFGGASHPDLLRWLAGPSGWIGTHDAVLVARGTGDGVLPERHDLEEHPRVIRARAHRRGVRVHGDDAGFVTLGRGFVGRLELSVELTDVTRSGAGAGRILIAHGRALVDPGALVWAQVAPGNAASLRAFLSAGFRPIGAETLFVPGSGRAAGTAS